MDHILAHSSEPVPAPEARGSETKKSNDDDDDEDEEAQISIGASSLENEAKVSLILQNRLLIDSQSSAAL